MILVQFSTGLKGQQGWKLLLVCTGIWRIGVVHIYLGIKLVAPNYFQYPMWGFCHVFQTLESRFGGLFRGAITRMLLLLAVSDYFRVSISCLWLCVWNWHQRISFDYHVILLSAFWKILLLGGTGKDGKRKSTGWLCRVSTCHLHLRDKRLSGRKCSRSFSYQFVLNKSWYGFGNCLCNLFVTHRNFLKMVFDPTSHAPLN